MRDDRERLNDMLESTHNAEFIPQPDRTIQILEGNPVNRHASGQTARVG